MAYNETPSTSTKEDIMKQQAILFTKDNASTITDTLIDYTIPADLLAEYEYMFATNSTLVLCKSVLEDGNAVLSYVVTESMFEANNPGHTLNDATFVTVREI